MLNKIVWEEEAITNMTYSSYHWKIHQYLQNVLHGKYHCTCSTTGQSSISMPPFLTFNGYGNGKLVWTGFIHWNTRSSCLKVFCIGVLINFAKFTGEHLWQRPATLSKHSLAQVFSCEFCDIFKKTFFDRTPPVAASKIRRLPNLHFSVCDTAGIFKWFTDWKSPHLFLLRKQQACRCPVTGSLCSRPSYLPKMDSAEVFSKEI